MIFYFLSCLTIRCYIPALSNQNVPVATFATFVATGSLQSPQLKEMCCKSTILLDISTKKQFWKDLLSPHLNGLSPHVANGDRVGQH
jgi:hypothetical protein